MLPNEPIMERRSMSTTTESDDTDSEHLAEKSSKLSVTFNEDDNNPTTKVSDSNHHRQDKGERKEKAHRPTKLDRKKSYKAQRKTYAKEKKRVEQELLSTFKDESIIVLADWLKVRGSLKSWAKFWCVLKPGLLLLYKSQKAKSSYWIGTIILSTCELIERPSKKNGFCFKLFHPMDQSIWASRGPDGENIGAVVQPLPTSHLIFRAPNNAAGKCWMDALELALRCSSLLVGTMSSKNATTTTNIAAITSIGTTTTTTTPTTVSSTTVGATATPTATICEGAELPRTVSLLNESDVENHFKSELGEEESMDKDDEDDDEKVHSESEEDDESDDAAFHEASGLTGELESPEEEEKMTNYVCDQVDEVFGTTGDQTEEFSDENKSIVWFLVKQVRPGMDLSKVVLPSFILEPRSFLEKISDYYYHSDILGEAVKNNEPFMRMKTIVSWYLSGFYKKPKGLKKPYNPILGEIFRCYWENPNGTKTFYLSEQVCHHPPISAYYVSNRQDGFTISASILAKSKFYGNSTSAILEGVATLCLLPRGEDYKMTMPYAHCKGILMGTMTMELGGKVTIACEKTGYSTELEFKLRPFLGGGELTNQVVGKLRLGKETLATIDGHWDDTVTIKDKKTGIEEVLWKVSPEVKKKRLKRFTVPLEEQSSFESVKLWKKVSDALNIDDQKLATEEKLALEEAQRASARERKASESEWIPKYFELDPMTGQYRYKHADHRPWDPRNDLYQYEYEMVIKTRTRHRTPMVRTQSIISVTNAAGSSEKMEKNGKDVSAVVIRRRRRSFTKSASDSVDASSTKGGSEGEAKAKSSPFKEETHIRSSKTSLTLQNLREALGPVEDQQKLMTERIDKLQHSVDVMLFQQRERDSNSNLNRDMVLLVILVVMIQAVLNWVLSSRAQHYETSGPPPPPDN